MVLVGEGWGGGGKGGVRGTDTDPIISKVSFSGVYVPDLARFDSVYEAHLEFANQRPRF